jgi:Zn-dependent protease with chaperone function
VGAPLAVLITPAVVRVIGLALKAVPGNEGAVENLVRWIDSVSESAWFALPVLLLPGMSVLLAIWLALQVRFQKAGIGALLSSPGVRPPRRDDAEEIQIGNVIEEMALASGCPVPAAFLLDTELANAAVVGVSENESAIVVSRGLLDGLARDEIQATVGHLIGSVANGDLRILPSWNAVFQSWDSFSSSSTSRRRPSPDGLLGSSRSRVSSPRPCFLPSPPCSFSSPSFRWLSPSSRRSA